MPESHSSESPTARTLRLVREEWTAPYRDALDMLAEAAEWYRRCLEDVQDGRPVRDFTEAKLTYDRAYQKARALLEQEGA